MNLYYWSCYPMHGLVWADNPVHAGDKVSDNLACKFPDEPDGAFGDVAVYPVWENVYTDFQMFDY